MRLKLDPALLPPLTSFLAGEWAVPSGEFDVLDKYTLKRVAGVGSPSKKDVSLAVKRLQIASERATIAPIDRQKILNATADAIERRRDVFTNIMIVEAGFTRSDAAYEVEKSQVVLRICAEESTRIAGETVPFGATEGQHDRIGFTIRAPLGVVCAITPFNSPLYTVCQKVGPAIAAGNTVLLKPSEHAPITEALLCQCFLEGGLPADHIALLQGRGAEIGPWLFEENAIAFYSFTGSTAVGRQIRNGAGIRRVQLEMSSIASTIVCADASLEKALPKIVVAAFRKAGQVCMSTQRLYVERPIFEEVLAGLVRGAEGMPAGDPMLPQTRIGPMISLPAAERAERRIDDARKNHAVVHCGGKREKAVLQPTVITGVATDECLIREELFSPVVTVIPFDQLSEAVSGANDTPYGLSVGIFTNNIEKAMFAARKLRFGGIHINETSSARADAMPFAGVKESGLGREGPKYAIQELTEERLVTFN